MAELSSDAPVLQGGLTEEMKRVVFEQKLGFVATVCPDGTPNLSPKGTTTVWDDDHLVFADIHSPGTVRNLRENSSIEINVVDPIVRKGYRFKGRAHLHSKGELYEKGLRLLAARGFAADRERIRTIVRIRIERAAALVSPAYDGDATEAEIAAKWERHALDLARRRREREREGSERGGRDLDDQTRDEASEPANVAVVRRFYDEIWNNWRVGVADEIVSPVVRFRGSLGIAISGRDAFKAYVEGVRAAFPDWHNQIDELLAVDDRVVARLTWTGTHQGELAGVAPTGKRVRYVGAAFFRVAAGQISEAWIVGDTQELWRTLGHLTTSIGDAVGVDNARSVQARD